MLEPIVLVGGLAQLLVAESCIPLLLSAIRLKSISSIAGVPSGVAPDV